MAASCTRFSALLIFSLAVRSSLPAQTVATAPEDVTPLAPMTVTGTRERTPLAETPASVGALAPAVIRETAPLHPGQLLGQIPGVAVAVTNGEGHTTAIRQPFTTSPVYLFLEDGIPVRATGFFNHNALYEVNLPVAGAVEVVRGPGTALYGSDAIGGVINVLSATPPTMPKGRVSGEMGSFGTARLIASSGGAVGPGALQADVNVTHTDGWRDETAYDRRSANLRIDLPIRGGGQLKTLLACSNVDQQTGANSPLPWADFQHDPTRNLLSIAFREVRAFRVSTTYEREFGAGQLSVVPYFRDNAMELNGTFNLNSDPRIERTANLSYGALLKWRQKLPWLRARAIAGVDVDYSPGSRVEDNLVVTRQGTGAAAAFTAYQVGTRIYDYEVTFRSVSPYLHTEASLSKALRITAGVRYDALSYAFANRLPAGVVAAKVLGATRYYGQLEPARTRFTRWTPKWGATYALTEHAHLYASYNFGFRAPSEAQLYRAGNDANAANALTKAAAQRELRPISARQLELGLRGESGAWSYDLVAYDLTKRDDLVTQRDLATNVSTVVNAGKTEHQGVEAGVGFAWSNQLRFDTALSYSEQRYVRWVTATSNFSGKTIEAAPHIMANTRLTWRRRAGGMLQLEWVRIGAYWLEASNSAAFGKYPGHDLINLRGSWPVTPRLQLFGRVMNLADRRFADSASVSSNMPVFSPGLPRSVYGGVEVLW